MLAKIRELWKVPFDLKLWNDAIATRCDLRWNQTSIKTGWGNLSMALSGLNSDFGLFFQRAMDLHATYASITHRSSMFLTASWYLTSFYHLIISSHNRPIGGLGAWDSLLSQPLILILIILNDQSPVEDWGRSRNFRNLFFINKFTEGKMILLLLLLL